MPRFFCKPENINDNKILIEGEDAHHMTNVLRMKIDENVVICDKFGTDYDCAIENFNEDKTVALTILKSYKNQSEPNVNITLYQAIPKSDKFEFIIQKAVELGVSKIVPIQSKYCIAKMDQKAYAKKKLRYNKIAYSASKQSGRGIIPEVCDILSYKEAIKQSQNGVLYYENGGIMTKEIITTTQDVSIFIGSEGGFSDDEVTFAIENDVKIATLGKLILRCETAPIIAIAMVLNATGNM